VIRLLKEFGDIADELGYGIYLVGGLVRDIFLKFDNLDVDIVIEGTASNLPVNLPRTTRHAYEAIRNSVPPCSFSGRVQSGCGHRKN
jgi:tRNA nucleotidyltransferase/poly(A) polymerase